MKMDYGLILSVIFIYKITDVILRKQTCGKQLERFKQWVENILDNQKFDERLRWSMDELKWKIVGDLIGHESTTKEIVEMYAADYGFSRPPQQSLELVPLDKEKFRMEYIKNMEFPDEKHLLDEQGLMAACAKFGSPKPPVVGKECRKVVDKSQ